MPLSRTASRYLHAGTLLAGILVAACHAPSGMAVEPDAADPPAAALNNVIREALADAASRTGLAGTDLVVERAEAVTWSDGSLGCPRPGVMYTQALVPGYRIVIRAGGQELSYHANRKGYWTYCNTPSVPDDASSPAQ
jgi:hypothetical protein